jgi:S-adenosylmethionine decarboxylase
MKAQMWNRRGWLPETDSEALRLRFDARLRASGFSVLAFCEYQFQPQGYTALWLLAESHFALHTFPEEGKSYFELSSCVEDKFNVFNAEIM